MKLCAKVADVQQVIRVKPRKNPLKRSSKNAPAAPRKNNPIYAFNHLPLIRSPLTPDHEQGFFFYFVPDNPVM